MSDTYLQHKLEHALFCYHHVFKVNNHSINFSTGIQQALKTNDWILAQILRSKKKDFINPFRKMMYDTQEEMDTVLGTLENIPFLDAAKQESS
jgi:hypothetical protein